MTLYGHVAIGDDPSGRPLRAVDPQGPTRPAVDLATPVLVVEDEAMIAWMLESLLEDAGFTDIRLAAGADEAVARALEGRPGLLVADINLGEGEDGIALAERLTAQGPLAVVFVSAYADEATRRRIAAAVPAAILLRKPVDADQLRAAIVATLSPPRPN